MSTSPITRWAGPISLAAAALILTSQLLNEALHLTHHDDAATTLKYALALLAQYVLLLALTGLYTRQATAVGTLGLVGYLVAFLGTLRGHLLPAAPAILVIIGGAVGALVLWTPYQIPLAIAVGWMGYHLVNAVPHDQHDAPVPAPANP